MFDCPKQQADQVNNIINRNKKRIRLELNHRFSLLSNPQQDQQQHSSSSSNGGCAYVNTPVLLLLGCCCCCCCRAASCTTQSDMGKGRGVFDRRDALDLMHGRGPGRIAFYSKTARAGSKQGKKKGKHVPGTYLKKQTSLFRKKQQVGRVPTRKTKRKTKTKKEAELNFCAVQVFRMTQPPQHVRGSRR